LTYTTTLAEAVAPAQLVILAVPSHALRAVACSLAPLLTGTPLLVSATKGIEEETLQTMTTVLAEELPTALRSHISVLSGPSFAGEVARGLPTAVTVAATHESVATDTQKVFSSSRFRVYTTTDVIGVEIGAQSRTSRHRGWGE
jgi:glycerol-3-phosphate dehydrogenase (NAD(P)+)